MDTLDLARRLGATPLFARLSHEQLQTLLEQSSHYRVAAGTRLADAASGLKDHLVLLDGELEVRHAWMEVDGSESSRAWTVVIDADGPGLALLSASSGHMTVRALADADYLLIDSEEVDELVDWSHMSGNLALARKLKVFQQVPRENMQLAFERMVERQVLAGETIVSQGEPGDSYYIILEGQAEVWVTDSVTDETDMVTVLTDSDAFGEEALLVGGTRTATVRMITPGRLLALAKSDFDALLKPGMVEEIGVERASDMLRRGEARLIDCRYEMEHEESRIPGAQLVPLGSLRREGVFMIDPEPTYIVYCRSGRRSTAAVFLLQERGVRAMSLAGGLKNWPYEVDETPL